MSSAALRRIIKGLTWSKYSAILNPEIRSPFVELMSCEREQRQTLNSPRRLSETCLALPPRALGPRHIARLKNRRNRANARHRQIRFNAASRHTSFNFVKRSKRLCQRRARRIDGDAKNPQA